MDEKFTAFLSLEEDAPLGIFISSDYEAGVIDLEEFFSESLIDMSPLMAQKHEAAFRRFADTLKFHRESLK